MTNEPEKRIEEDYYFPIFERLRDIFDRWYVDEPYAVARDGVMKAPSSGITNPHLKITAHGEFDDKLHRVFDYRLFAALYAERLKPDIMGFVKRNKKSEPEIITVEVKIDALSIQIFFKRRCIVIFLELNTPLLFHQRGFQFQS